MSWRYHGRAKVDPTSPQAFGVCDRDGMLYNLRDLFYQFDWTGPRLQNLRIRVCRRCLDRPQDQLRPVVTGADPVPVVDPRPENYAAETGPPPAAQTAREILEL